MTAEQYMKRMEHLIVALSVLVDRCEYTTPAGSKNCRYCDNNMDHEGTYENMHDAVCPIRDAQLVLREVTKP